MIYLVRIADTIEIAACEDESRVPALQAAGYQVVTQTQFRSAWRARDLKTFMAQVSSLPPQPPKERAVGSPANPSVPNGFKKYVTWKEK